MYQYPSCPVKDLSFRHHEKVCPHPKRRRRGHPPCRARQTFAITLLTDIRTDLSNMPKKRNAIKNNERARLHQEKKRRLHEAEHAAQELQQQHGSLGETLHDPSTGFGTEQHPPASEAVPNPQSVSVSVKLEDAAVGTSPSALSDVSMEFDNRSVIPAVSMSSSYKVEGT